MLQHHPPANAPAASLKLYGGHTLPVSMPSVVCVKVSISSCWVGAADPSHSCWSQTTFAAADIIVAAVYEHGYMTDCNWPVLFCVVLCRFLTLDCTVLAAVHPSQHTGRRPQPGFVGRRTQGIAVSVFRPCKMLGCIQAAHVLCMNARPTGVFPCTAFRSEPSACCCC